jgi:glutathione S-transferase
MKLYFSPGACSLSPHIILQESGLPFTIEKVDLRSKQTASGADYLAINPKGYVPALEMDDGVLLTEGPAIVQYLADQVPDKQLAPANGSMERYQLMSWLTFIGTEIHKNYSPLFNPASTDDAKASAKQALAKRYAYVERMLDGREYLVGTQFSVTDGYLFVVTNWSGMLKLDMSAFPNIAAFQQRIGARPAVRQAMQAEGLIN